MKARQEGAVLIEFALVFLMLIMFLFGLTDFSRLLYTWNAATEATRLGARYAVVCSAPGNQGSLMQKMQAMVPEITEIQVEWDGPAGCTAETCLGVTVSITELDFQWVTPVLEAVKPRITISDQSTFRTYLPREAMRQDGNTGVICD